jgi:tetratricopeptide (TPR) repeat protein
MTLGLVEGLQLALRRDHRADVVKTLQQLVALQAPLGEQWMALAMIAAHNGEIGLARQAGDLFVESQGGNARAESRKVDLLAQFGAWSEVLDLLRKLPSDLPNPYGHAYARGTAALYLGERDEARHQLEAAIRLNPLGGSPWLSLSMLIDFAAEDGLTKRVIAAERAMAAAPPLERGSYYYALGKAHADHGEHALAFAAYSRGAAITKPVFPYSREEDRRTAAEAVAGYDAERVAALARQQTEPTDRCIFVRGLPRSGTTLVEQILTSHSAVCDGAEIYRLALLVKDVGGRTYEAVKAYVDAGRASEAARLWQHWLDERFPLPGRIVNKTLNNSRNLGLAAALLPEAPLIWLRRDPLDCAWSCFRSRFAGEAAWSYDLEDIAYHFRLEDELLDRWQEILGEKLLVVPFESLVSDPEPWIRQILAHCGLAEEPQVFTPHENPRPVTTSSVMQVRRPINRDGIGSAEPYREFMAPFIAAYYR